MFCFLKSKKGFTLVELMIVVVIMAILVAVAVPIYTAVTANAKRKTCLANQREIQAQLTNATMLNTIAIKTGDSFTLTSTAADGGNTADGGTWACDGGNTGLTGDDGVEEIGKLFQKPPYCPVAGSVISVTVEEQVIGDAENSGMKVTTVCSSANGHS